MRTRGAAPTCVPVIGLVIVAAALAAIAVPAPVLSAAPDIGVFTWNKTRLKMLDAYAYKGPDAFDAKKQVTVVTVSTVKFDRTKIDGALDRESAINEQAREGKGTVIQLVFEADGSLHNLNAQIRTPEGYQSISTSGTLKAALKANTAQRIAGRVQSGGTQTFSKDKYSYDFTFDIAIAPDLPPGDPLPAGGGEPGKAYVAMVAALQKGDVVKLAQYWPKDKADAMLAARKDPGFKDQLEMLKAFSPKTVKVTGGTLRKDTADLDVVGKDTDGNVMDGKVRMIRDGKGWRVEAEHLTTHTK